MSPETPHTSHKGESGRELDLIRNGNSKADNVLLHQAEIKNSVFLLERPTSNLFRI